MWGGGGGCDSEFGVLALLGPGGRGLWGGGGGAMTVSAACWPGWGEGGRGL